MERRTANIERRTSKWPIFRTSLFSVRSPVPRLEQGASRSGQAIVEFIVGLVAILVVAAVLLQIGRLTRAHTRALIEAREEAGVYAVADVYSLRMPGPNYIADWAPGPDERRYSMDDEWVGASPSVLASDILSHAHPGELGGWVPGNAVTGLAGGGSPLGGFDLVHGRSVSEAIPLSPIVRSLVYAVDEIEMESDVWLVWTQGTY